mmetsp:Transcript_85504/g.275850  ORF Transcript_85504/g.275850 Transcript_85504/m.275850 type:complete len:212 (-) Transcript_85504:2424-3059(-)
MPRQVFALVDVAPELRGEFEPRFAGGLKLQEILAQVSRVSEENGKVDIIPRGGVVWVEMLGGSKHPKALSSLGSLHRVRQSRQHAGRQLLPSLLLGAAGDVEHDGDVPEGEEARDTMHDVVLRLSNLCHDPDRKPSLAPALRREARRRRQALQEACSVQATDSMFKQRWPNVLTTRRHQSRRRRLGRRARDCCRCGRRLGRRGRSGHARSQ